MGGTHRAVGGEQRSERAVRGDASGQEEGSLEPQSGREGAGRCEGNVGRKALSLSQKMFLKRKGALMWVEASRRVFPCQPLGVPAALKIGVTAGSGRTDPPKQHDRSGASGKL